MLFAGLLSSNGAIGQYIYNYGEGRFWDILMWIGVILLVGEGALMLVYAWIINPIKSLIARRKEKEDK